MNIRLETENVDWKHKSTLETSLYIATLVELILTTSYWTTVRSKGKLALVRLENKDYATQSSF